MSFYDDEEDLDQEYDVDEETDEEETLEELSIDDSGHIGNRRFSREEEFEFEDPED